MKKIGYIAKQFVGRLMICMAIMLGLAIATQTVNAATDITGVVDTVSGYWDAVVAVSIAVLLFVIGRRVVRKL